MGPLWEVSAQEVPGHAVQREMLALPLPLAEAERRLLAVLTEGAKGTLCSRDDLVELGIIRPPQLRLRPGRNELDRNVSPREDCDIRGLELKLWFTAFERHNIVRDHDLVVRG